MKSRILIVDDITKNIQLLATILEPTGCEIEFATNGYEAIDWVMNSDFDLILLDVMMPDKNGYMVCAEIKAIPGKADIPIIFLTAKNDLDSITKGFDMGAVDYVTKPYNSKELLARINTHVELKRGRAQLQKMNEILEVKVRERTNELEMARQQLETLDVAKTEFLKMISHEVRTPLNGILNAYWLLKEPSNGKNLDKLFQVLDESVNRLEKYSFTALQITQLVTLKERALHFTKISLHEIVESCVKSTEEEFSNKGLKLKILETEPNVVFGDKMYLKSGIMQIFDNAIEYALENTTVTIEIKGDKDCVLLTFKNQGPGFSEKALKNLFRPFCPGEEFVNNNSGLGLFFVKLLVHLQSGTINVGNTKEGAFVEIALPIEKSA